MLQKLVHKTPATLVMASLTILNGIIFSLVWGHNYNQQVLAHFGYGLPALQAGNFTSMITGVFFATPLWVYLVVMPTFLLGALFVEYTKGTKKMLINFFSGQVISVLAVSLILIIGDYFHVGWALGLSKELDVGLSNGALALIGISTALLPLYWRFRLRLVIFISLLAMVLFSAEISDLTHFSGFLFGLAIGPIVAARPYGRVQFFKPTVVNQRSFTAILLLFYAITHFVTLAIPGKGGLLAFGQPANDISFITSTTIVLIALLFSYGLAQGRKIAWLLTTPLALVLLYLDSLNMLIAPTGLNIFKFFYMALIFISLVLFRKSFTAKTDTNLFRQTLKKLTIGAMLIFILNVTIIMGLRNSFTPVPTLGQASHEALLRVVNVSTGQFTPNTRTTTFTLALVDDIWLVYFLLALLLIVITASIEPPTGNKKLYLELLQKWGGNNISWMGTWDNLNYFTNSSQTAILAYKREGSVAIVLGDPVGSRQTAQKLLLSFNEDCTRQGLIVSYFSCSAWVMRFLEKHGFKHAQVAEDTIVPLGSLEFTGKAWQSVRSSLNKAAKEKIKMQVIAYAEAPFSIKDQLQIIENSWVSDKSLPEMGFTLGNLKEAKDEAVRMHIAIDEEGNIHGMTSWLPVYEKGGSIKGWTLDIMQRRLDEATMPGVMEFLIASSAQKFKEEGYQYISLSGAPLSLTGEPENLIEKVMQWAAVKFEPYYGFASLHRFKEKFQPVHEPMYFCYKNADQLPLIGLAIGRAYMNDANFKDLIAQV